MGEYNFTYKMPNNLRDKLVQHLRQNGNTGLAQAVQHCDLEYKNLGFAYYAGLEGDTWDRYAVDFIFYGPGRNINILRPSVEMLKDIIQKFLRPSKSGYLVRNVEFFVSEEELEVSLPVQQSETFEILSRDIHDALGRNEPVLVLDRLHTYLVKYFRDICGRHGIPIEDSDGNKYPLQSLVGSLTKYYDKIRAFESDFTSQTLKMSISLFDKYNAIRNNKSYAHDNTVLDNAEAKYAVTVVTATLTLIHEIERKFA